MAKKMKITFLGTGHATVTKIYNTCFLFKKENVAEIFLVDAGGGNEILRRLELAKLDINDIKHMFISHKHTDHILGAVWIVRKIIQEYRSGNYKNKLKFYGSEDVKNVLYEICRLTLKEKFYILLDDVVSFNNIEKKNKYKILNRDIEFFDINSVDDLQYGFKYEFEKGKVLTFLGDQPFNESSREFVWGADWLIHEAFCRYEDRDRFKPYQKAHVTVKEACEVAEEKKVNNLILCHTEDSLDKKKTYTEESKSYYFGNIYIPNDMEEITLH